ncbi:MAG: hypothetical protein ABGY75_03550, partial [Gemmataceae bacterium]
MPVTVWVNAPPPAVPVSVRVYTSAPAAATDVAPVTAFAVVVAVDASTPVATRVKSLPPLSVWVALSVVVAVSTVVLRANPAYSRVVFVYAPVLVSRTLNVPADPVPQSVKNAVRVPDWLSVYHPPPTLPVPDLLPLSDRI